MVSRRHRLPLLGQGHNGASVKDSEAEQMVVLEADAVHFPVEAVLGVKQRVTLGRQHCEMLYVAPGEHWTENTIYNT